MITEGGAGGDGGIDDNGGGTDSDNGGRDDGDEGRRIVRHSNGGRGKECKVSASYLFWGKYSYSLAVL